jgi:hypothetical protein
MSGQPDAPLFIFFSKIKDKDQMPSNNKQRNGYQVGIKVQ